MNAVTQDLIHAHQSQSGVIGRDAGATSVVRLARILRQWHARARQRRQLSGLTRWELEDVGISAGAAATESAKPFWRP